METRKFFMPLISLLLCLSFQHSHANELLYEDSFEIDFGNWTISPDSTVQNWKRNNSNTPTPNTGPNTGSNSTYYLYADASEANIFDTSSLLSPLISHPKVNLSFDYHMYGRDTGTLSVDILVGNRWLENIWQRTGPNHESGNAEFTQAEINLSSYPLTRIRLRVSDFSGPEGDIAVDNIKIQSIDRTLGLGFISSPILKPLAKADSNYAESLQQHVRNPSGEPVTFHKISGPNWLALNPDGELEGTPAAINQGLNTFLVAVASDEETVTEELHIVVHNTASPMIEPVIQSSFELGFGHWENAENDKTNWLRHSNNTPSNYTGPNSGANGSEHYIYFETSAGHANAWRDSAVLMSPNLFTTFLTLSMDYHMFGADIGTLAVDVNNGSEWDENIWRVYGQHHNSAAEEYSSNTLSLHELDAQQIRIRAIAKGGYRGDIALDNLNFYFSDQAFEDEDFDGIINFLDKCLATPTEESVNIEGCSPAQVDSDGDGFFDDVDLYPFDPDESGDCDQDGIANGQDRDDDNDLVPDWDDAFPCDPSESRDNDGDRIGDNADTDDDNDGMSDIDEGYYGTNPFSPDTDGDLIDDLWELTHQLNPFVNDANSDFDNDGFTNMDEYLGGSDPNDPASLPLPIFNDLSLGKRSSCALLNNAIHCWGGYGSYKVPDSIQTPSSVSHNLNNVCAVDNGELDCWGYEYSFVRRTLNTNPITNAVKVKLDPNGDRLCVTTTEGKVKCIGYSDIVQPPNTLENVSDVQLNLNHACSHNEVQVECWGDNHYNQNDVPTDLVQPKELALGEYHSCALQQNGQVKCWGLNTSNQISVPADLPPIKQIAAAENYTCALSLQGDIYCWGDNSFINFDDLQNLSQIERIYAGPTNMCVIDSSKKAKCFGNNDDGQSSIWYNMKAFDIGDRFVCGINDDEVMCFGSNGMAQTDLPSAANTGTPITIGLGGDHSCVWTTTGMHCWGSNDENQLDFPSDLSDVSEIDGGKAHTCAIDAGQVKCWGSNEDNLSTPPSGIAQASSLSSTAGHNCVLDLNSLKCWGNNGNFQAPQEFELSSPTIAAVGGIYQSPSTEDFGHTCVVDDGLITCFGSNDGGIIEGFSDIRSPVDLFVGRYLGCAITQEQTLRCWGDLQSPDTENLFAFGPLSKIEGYDNEFCVQGEHILACTQGGALLINPQ